MGSGLWNGCGHSPVPAPRGRRRANKSRRGCIFPEGLPTSELLIFLPSRYRALRGVLEGWLTDLSLFNLCVSTAGCRHLRWFVEVLRLGLGENGAAITLALPQLSHKVTARRKNKKVKAVAPASRRAGTSEAPQ